MMRGNQWKSLVLTAAIGLGLGLSALSGVARAQPPKPGEREAKPETTVKGKVLQLIRNDRDDVDGLLLDNDVKVHFPPHIGREVVKLVKKGDNVRILGREEKRPKGETVFVATQIESQGTTIKVAPPRPPQERPMTAKGTVRELITNRAGDVDGLRLEDGTEVKFPPHQGKELKTLVSKGDVVRIEGHRHETPKGDVHLHADVITSVDTGKSIKRDEPRPRPTPPPPPAGKPRDKE